MITFRSWFVSIELALVLLLNLSLLPQALAEEPLTTRAASRHQFEVKQQFGTFLRRPLGEVATNRLQFEYQQKLKISPAWTFVFGGRVRSESAYAMTPHSFGAAQAREESTEAVPRDFYTQFTARGFSLAVGYQQVVWGEAFGFFFSDIINAKDLREAGFLGLFDLADFRDSAPIVNARLIRESWSLQAVWLPWSAKDRLPAEDSPYNPLTAFRSKTPTPLAIDRGDIKQDKHGDYGARLSIQLGDYDFSFYGFSYLDRTPYLIFQDTTTSPPTLHFAAGQKRIFTTGTTATVSAGDWLWRLEVLNTPNLVRNRLDQAGFITDEMAQRLVGVIGCDLPPLGPWAASLQYSKDVFYGSETMIGRRRDQQLAGVQFRHTSANGNEIEISHFQDLVSNSSFSRLRTMLVYSQGLEFLLGLESVQGPQASEFGWLAEMGRVMIGFRGVLP